MRLARHIPIRTMTARALVLVFLVMALALGASCAPAPTTTLPTTAAPVIPQATAAPNLHAPEVRFALIGEVTDANVWGLFDSQGYSYNNYAIRSAYWPRLFQLSIPDGRFEPRAAAGMPTQVQADGSLFTASVPLRSDLAWTDGSPFTAQDVAFTVNTALGFQLGFDWHAYYDPEWLDYAAAIDAHTVKFYFKRAPTVATWQYGTLQGPIVQKQYWEPKIGAAAALLPPPDSTANIETLTQKVADVQKRVDALVAAGVKASGEQARQLQLELQRRQGDLDEARNDLSKAQTSLDTAMEAARQALCALDAKNEPTLGTWIPAGRQSGIWVNEANPSYPFGIPNFDRATYESYADQAAALAAIDKGEVDSLLDPHGLATDLTARVTPLGTLSYNSTATAHFLVINQSNPALSARVLRYAMSCSIDRPTLVQSLTATPLKAFILPGNSAWSSPGATVLCGGPWDPLKGTDPVAVEALKSAGYTWTTEPTGDQAGAGLKMPDGQPFPPVRLLAPSAEADPQAAMAAQFVEGAVRRLGIPLSVQSVDPAEIRFALFNDGGYDMAIASWRLSTYPGYLCNWFGDGNPFGYSNEQVRAACQALGTTSDLETARQQVSQIETVLAQDLPFIPLYSGLTYDVYRGIRYNFNGVLDGLSGVYGAPALAVPNPP